MSHQGKVRVLIAEDDYLVSEMIKGLLEEAGYSVIGGAAGGVEAVAMVKSLRPDVVLMDVKMPDRDGIEATRIIQECCPTPVVMLTAFETPELLARASEAGAGAYLVKPSSLREMERAITIAMARFEDMMELRRLNADLQARNEELDAFAHTVAHGLQNPLALALGFADILRTYYTDASDTDLQECLRAIMQNVRKMSNIIEELMLLAEVRKVEAEVKPLDMASIVAEAQRRLGHLVGEYRPEITVSDTWPVALGYAPWVEEVWVNYISNAIKYGGRPPHVELGATVQSDGMVRFWVRDNGPGLPEEARAQLFLPFTQLHQVRTGGHGLGLSIVRRIVEKLGGQVYVESQVGQGSVFAFTLPYVAS
jgi:two-component system sensor histidine kinase/response regulator